MRTKIFFLLVLLQLSASAQRLKYKELFPLLADMSPSEQLSALRDYVSYDLNHPNANLRLALLHERNYKLADPLTQFASVMAHAQEASIRYLKAKQLVTEQQVRSDNEFYQPIFGQIDSKGKLNAPFAPIQNKIQRGYDSAMLIQQKLPAIVQAFTKSVNQYDKAVKLFATINNRYKSEEDIWMFYTPEFEKELNQLAFYYDSSLYYFSRYRSLITEYPLKKYNQQTSIQEIKTYRLDGLINRMTFLEKKVILWDYRKWAEYIKENYEKEIVPMLQQLYSNENVLSERLKQIPVADVKPAKIEKELIYDLNNFDKNSLALALLRYKAFQQEWLLRQKAISTDTTLNQRLELFSALIAQNRVADSLYADAAAYVNAENIVKHKNYLGQFYGGKEGLTQFLKNQKQTIDATLAQYQETLKKNLALVAAPKQNLAGKYMKFGAFNVPLFTSDTIPKTLDNNTWVTQHRLVSADGSLYLLGVAKPDKKNNNQQVFVARIGTDGKPAWLQPYNLSIDSGVTDAASSVRAAVLTPEGCAFLVSSVHLTRGDAANTFMFVNEKKEERVRKRLKDITFVRHLLYREETNSFVLVLKGNTATQNFVDQEPISFISINVLGDLIWRRDIILAGTLTDVVPVRDGYVMAGNFTYLRDLAGKEFRTRLAAGQANPYLIKLSAKGDVQKIQPLPSDKSVFLDRVIKVSDASINLLATDATFESPSSGATIKHAMLNYQLTLICSTL